MMLLLEFSSSFSCFYIVCKFDTLMSAWQVSTIPAEVVFFFRFWEEVENAVNVSKGDSHIPDLKIIVIPIAFNLCRLQEDATLG